MKEFILSRSDRTRFQTFEAERGRMLKLNIVIWRILYGGIWKSKKISHVVKLPLIISLILKNLLATLEVRLLVTLNIITDRCMLVNFYNALKHNYLFLGKFKKRLVFCTYKRRKSSRKRFIGLFMTSDYDLPSQGYNNWMVAKYRDKVDNSLFIDFIDVHLKCQLVVTINI